MAYEWLTEATEDIILAEAVEVLDVLYEWGEIDEYDYEEILESYDIDDFALLVEKAKSGEQAPGNVKGEGWLDRIKGLGNRADQGIRTGLGWSKGKLKGAGEAMKAHPYRTGLGVVGAAGLAYGGKKLMDYRHRRAACIQKGHTPGTDRYKQCLKSMKR